MDINTLCGSSCFRLEGFRLRRNFLVANRSFDITLSGLFIPGLAAFAVLGILFNPYPTKGRLWFAQNRMGRNCQRLRAWTFRTVTALPKTERPADCPLAVERMTQLLNAPRGDMRLIGPRPECDHHAHRFLSVAPRYWKRRMVRPGISRPANPQSDMSRAPVPRPGRSKPTSTTLPTAADALRHGPFGGALRMSSAGPRRGAGRIGPKSRFASGKLAAHASKKCKVAMYRTGRTNPANCRFLADLWRCVPINSGSQRKKRDFTTRTRSVLSERTE